MSRIYRSLDQRKIADVDLRTRPMGPQRPERPAGGIAGFDGERGLPEVLTQIERRERDSLRMVEEAQRQAETIQRDAYRAGFEQGERAGEKLALQKIEPILQSFRELLASIEKEREKIIRANEQELIKVAFALATQVLHTAIELQPEVLRQVVEAALAKVTTTHHIVMQVSPYDRQLIERQMRLSEGAAWPPPYLKLEADEGIGRGGCRIVTETGDIDATIDTQLRVLKSMLWDDDVSI